MANTHSSVLGAWALKNLPRATIVAYFWYFRELHAQASEQ